MVLEEKPEHDSRLPITWTIKLNSDDLALNVLHISIVRTLVILLHIPGPNSVVVKDNCRYLVCANVREGHFLRFPPHLASTATSFSLPPDAAHEVEKRALGVSFHELWRTYSSPAQNSRVRWRENTAVYTKLMAATGLAGMHSFGVLRKEKSLDERLHSQ